MTPQDDKPKLMEGYVLQVGAFRERGRAESLSKQIEEEGFNAFVEEAPVSQGEMAHRVRVAGLIRNCCKRRKPRRSFLVEAVIKFSSCQSRPQPERRATEASPRES